MWRGTVLVVLVVAVVALSMQPCDAASRVNLIEGHVIRWVEEGLPKIQAARTTGLSLNATLSVHNVTVGGVNPVTFLQNAQQNGVVSSHTSTPPTQYYTVGPAGSFNTLTEAMTHLSAMHIVGKVFLLLLSGVHTVTETVVLPKHVNFPIEIRCHTATALDCNVSCELTDPGAPCFSVPPAGAPVTLFAFSVLNRFRDAYGIEIFHGSSLLYSMKMFDTVKGVRNIGGKARVNNLMVYGTNMSNAFVTERNGLAFVEYSTAVNTQGQVAGSRGFSSVVGGIMTIKTTTIDGFETATYRSVYAGLECASCTYLDYTNEYVDATGPAITIVAT